MNRKEDFDDWLLYEVSPSLTTKIVGTIIIISMLFFMCYGIVSFIRDIC